MRMPSRAKIKKTKFSQSNKILFKQEKINAGKYQTLFVNLLLQILQN